MSNKNKSGSEITAELDDVVEFLRQLDWPSEVVSERVVKTSYQGEFGESEVNIFINEQDVCMLIDPVVERLSPDRWGCSVVSLVSAMSQEIKHIGMGIDGNGDLFVKVHLPLAHVNLERFHCLLLGLCQVAENLLLPVLQANAYDHLQSPSDK